MPLSPNHGLFGMDGLYSESKIALETLFAKWRSEGWGVILSIMDVWHWSDERIIAQAIKKETGLRTFDANGDGLRPQPSCPPPWWP